MRVVLLVEARHGIADPVAAAAPRSRRRVDPADQSTCAVRPATWLGQLRVRGVELLTGIGRLAEIGQGPNDCSGIDLDGLTRLDPERGAAFDVDPAGPGCDW
jgi:hypothetical protein